MSADDAQAVLRIYQASIDGGLASFETTAPTREAFDTAKLPEHRLVALDESGSVLGWGAYSQSVFVRAQCRHGSLESSSGTSRAARSARMRWKRTGWRQRLEASVETSAPTSATRSGRTSVTSPVARPHRVARTCPLLPASGPLQRSVQRCCRCNAADRQRRSGPAAASAVAPACR
jgi:hypothetical protein